MIVHKIKLPECSNVIRCIKKHWCGLVLCYHFEFCTVFFLVVFVVLENVFLIISILPLTL